MNLYVKIGLIAAAVAALVYGEVKLYDAGYSAGATKVQVKSDAAVISSEKAAVAQAASAVATQQDWAKKDQQAVASSVAADQQVRVVYRTITQQVVKYVQSHPATATCGLDADGVRIWNAANAAAVPASIAAPASVPKPASGLSSPAFAY